MIPMHIRDNVPAVLFLELAVAISVYFSSYPYTLINWYAARSRPGLIRAPEGLLSLSPAPLTYVQPLDNDP
jgi:hypothetical protein